MTMMWIIISLGTYCPQAHHCLVYLRGHQSSSWLSEREVMSCCISVELCDGIRCGDVYILLIM